MSEVFDIAIIGSGPAGLSAALNAKIRNKKFILLGENNLSCKLEKAPKINNYLGFYGVTGKKLKDNFLSHIKQMNIEINEERIKIVYSMGDYFALVSNLKMYKAKAIILATGVNYTKTLEGESEFLGKGVGYCATCDAQLYKDKVVSIISYSEEGIKDAEYVSEIARKVNYIPMHKENYRLSSKINIVKDRPIKIIGNNKVEKLVLKGITLNTDGVFLLKDSISPNELVPGLEMIDGHVIVDRMMNTNIEGCFAAGDCTGVPYQFMKAAGEGNIASLSAIKYLNLRR